MKIRTVILAVALLMPFVSQAADEDLGLWVEAQVPSRGPSKILGWYEKDFSETVGMYVLTEAESDGYRQFYLGPRVKPLDWLTLGIGIGRETFHDEFSGTRKNAYVNAEFEKLSVWWIYETGPSGPWKKFTVTKEVSKNFGAGGMYETGLGYGPRVEYNLTRDKKTQIWGAVLYDNKTGDNTILFAVNHTF